MSQPEVSVELDRLEDLFAAPQIAPFEGRFSSRTGVQQLIDAIEDAGLARTAEPITVVIRTPEGGDVAVVAAAIRGYCDERLARDASELRMLRRAGHYSLRIGIALLAGCLLISASISSMSFLPGFIRRVLGESFGIAGWVVLWRPIELLVFEPWPVRRDVRMHKRLRDASFRVVATGGAAAG